MGAVRRIPAVVVAATLLLPLAACGDHVDALSSIGARGTGEGAYRVTAIIPSAADLVRNAPVMMRDTTVGSVARIEVVNWSAKVTVRLEKDVKVPRGSHAMVSMTSVLGSSHLEIVPPEHPSGELVAPGGALAATDCPEADDLAQPQGRPIPGVTLAQHIDPCRYPTTEQVLSSLSVVLNGGGLGRLGDVVAELSDALGGRGDELSSLIPRLDTLMTDLEKQTGDIITATRGLDRLTARIDAQGPVVARALDSGPQILQLLVDQRKNLIASLDAVGRLSATANQIMDRSTDDIEVIVPNMRALLDQLSQTGPALTNSLRILLTFPFLQEQISTLVKGDYVNSDLVLDLTFDRLNRTMLTSVGLTGPEGLLGTSAGNARRSTDPLTAPFGRNRQTPRGQTPNSRAPGAPRSSTPARTAPHSSTSTGPTPTSTGGGHR
ncbi:MAG: MlaD family protein [Gordonia sp. (in: high G+C Gram-positive bacteria)]|uniref:MlaD family protein n=1 Tax=Gordonia sp. (in: high G+C Gram-positive bacteria) TaxID=84139 RepID=UPI0039E5B8D6